MNLCIDQGNTRAKVAIFDRGEMVAHATYDSLTQEIIDQLLAQYPISQCIISTVAGGKQAHAYLSERLSRVVVLDHTTLLPIVNRYDTPETLGKDRLAAIVGANYIQPNADLLVIDAGTAITYDYVNGQNEYIGGNIAPGLTMRFEALAHFTQQLPLVKACEVTKGDELWGKTTLEAIQKGVEQGLTFEIESYISELNKKNANFSVFLTGGDANYFRNRLKSAIFVEVFLVLIGLNRILDYNAQL